MRNDLQILAVLILVLLVPVLGALYAGKVRNRRMEMKLDAILIRLGAETELGRIDFENHRNSKFGELYAARAVQSAVKEARYRGMSADDIARELSQTAAEEGRTRFYQDAEDEEAPDRKKPT